MADVAPPVPADQPAKNEVDEALEQVKAVYEEKLATINGRDYKFTATSHSQRVKVFAFFSKVQYQLQTNDMSFLDTDEFRVTERVINNIVTFEGSLLSRIPQHWEEFPEDYIMLVTVALGVISYPFLRGKRTV